VLLATVAVALPMAGCHRFSPTAPSPAWRETLPAWSPYVGISPDNTALGGYQQALTLLTSRSAALGARISLFADGRSVPTVQLVTSFGLEVVGLIDNADLFAPDVAAVFDQYVAAYPQVRVFQIGDEVTTSSMPMSIDQYLDVLARIYGHVIDRYPNVTLVSEAAFGSGTIGAMDLAALAPGLAARGIMPAHLIIGINVYSENAFTAYASVLATNLTAYRIWVTETGIADPTQQISYVQTMYPRLRASLRAERIYWYALWAGDTGADSGFSLIHAPTTSSIAQGPLFQLLVQ
jgi:hypothetical protein